MPKTSRKKRKGCGAVRDFDENSLKQRDEGDNDMDIDSYNENISSGSNSSIDSDLHSPCGIDTDNEEYPNVDRAKNHQRNKTKIGIVETCKVQIKKKEDTKYSEIKNKKDKKQSLSVDSAIQRSLSNVAVKVESDDFENDKGTREQKKKIDSDSFDLVLSSSILNGGGGRSDNQCTLLVEVSNSRDAIALGEFGGSIGAIGRFESDPSGITLDLKGNQYRGSLLPGPSCFIVGFSQPFGMKKKDLSTGPNKNDDQEEVDAGKLRVEAIADEYATLVQIDDHMKKLDAVVIENQNEKYQGASS